MRFLLFIAAGSMLIGTGCGPKTCDQLGFQERDLDFFEVTMPGGVIQATFDPPTAAEVLVESEDGDVVWHALCDADDDGIIPDCLNSPQDISGTPDGASNPVETGSFEAGVVYTIIVRDYDVECDDQVRSGEGEPFTLAR